MPIVAKLDELGRPAWIALTILGFMVWWPIGLAALVFTFGSGRMSCWKNRAVTPWGGGASPWSGVSENRSAGTWWQPTRSSGNQGLRRVPPGHPAPARGRAARIPQLLVRLRMAKGQGRVRPVDGPHAHHSVAAAAGLSSRSTWSIARAIQRRPKCMREHEGGLALLIWLGGQSAFVRAVPAVLVVGSGNRIRCNTVPEPAPASC